MNMCSAFVNMKRSLFGGGSYNCRRQEADWPGNWQMSNSDDDEGETFRLLE